MDKVRHSGATRYRQLHEARQKRERWVSSFVRDVEHLVSERRNEQEIHLRHHARHLAGHFTTQTIGLHKVDRREKTRLAEEVRPRIGNLYLELVRLTTQRQLLERCCRLGEEDHVERVVGPVGERDRRRDHAELPCRLERRTVDVRRRRFLHPGLDVPNAQPFYWQGCIEV